VRQPHHGPPARAARPQRRGMFRRRPQRAPASEVPTKSPSWSATRSFRPTTNVNFDMVQIALAKFKADRRRRPARPPPFMESHHAQPPRRRKPTSDRAIPRPRRAPRRLRHDRHDSVTSNIPPRSLPLPGATKERIGIVMGVPASSTSSTKNTTQAPRRRPRKLWPPFKNDLKLYVSPTRNNPATASKLSAPSRCAKTCRPLVRLPRQARRFVPRQLQPKILLHLLPRCPQGSRSPTGNVRGVRLGTNGPPRSCQTHPQTEAFRLPA